MIYLISDTHGDFSRIKKVKGIKSTDVLFILGDFGFMWEDSPEELKTLKKIGKLKHKTVFLDGCHENFNMLGRYENSQLFGGSVKNISGNLYYVNRGQVLTLEGKKFFCMGGGSSEEVDSLIEGVSWWPQELPSSDEMAQGLLSIEQAGGEVDYILTHAPSYKIRKFLSIDDGYEVNIFTAYLDKIQASTVFGKWFFGMTHIDKLIPPRYIAVYKDAVKL